MTPPHGGPGRPTLPVPPAGCPVSQPAPVGPETLSYMAALGRPYPRNGPGRHGGTQAYPPLCGGLGGSIIPKLPTGRPYPPNGPGRIRGTRVPPPLCGGY